MRGEGLMEKRMHYFCPDLELDRQLIGRTLAELDQISEIASETTSGEAFRKYVLAYIKSRRVELEACCVK